MLREKYPGDRYPANWTTLFKTPRNPIATTPMGQGSMLYIGIEKGLKIYSFSVLKDLNELILDIGIDGFAIACSSGLCGWPILGSVVGRRAVPFLIAMYVGGGQPKDVDMFLEQFCQEVDELRRTGIQIVEGGPRIPFRLRLFSCDTPARCAIACTRYFAHKAGCHKCDQRSVRIGKHNFYSIHHSDSTKWRSSPIERIGGNMITMFPLDVMHLIDLGVAKMILLAILKEVGTLTADKMSKMHALYKKFKRREFARAPRGFKHANKFKATEYRQFLLYTGVVLLKQFLSP